MLLVGLGWKFFFTRRKYSGNSAMNFFFLFFYISCNFNKSIYISILLLFFSFYIYQRLFILSYAFFKKIINEFSWKSFTPKTTLSTTKIKFLQWLNSSRYKSFEKKIKFIYSPRYITLLNTLVMICSSGFNVSPNWNREKKNKFLLSIDALNIKIRKRERERDKCCTLSFILYPNTFFIDFPWNGSLDAAKCTA